jgi:hypothetical protein
LLGRKKKMATFVRNGKALARFFLNLRVDDHESTRDAFYPEKRPFIAICFEKDELKSDLGEDLRQPFSTIIAKSAEQ